MHTHVAWVKIKLYSSLAALLAPASVHHKIWQPFSQEARRGATDFTPFPNQDVWRLRQRRRAALQLASAFLHISKSLLVPGVCSFVARGAEGACSPPPPPWAPPICQVAVSIVSHFVNIYLYICIEYINILVLFLVFFAFLRNESEASACRGCGGGRRAAGPGWERGLHSKNYLGGPSVISC